MFFVFFPQERTQSYGGCVRTTPGAPPLAKRAWSGRFLNAPRILRTTTCGFLFNSFAVCGGGECKSDCYSSFFIVVLIGGESEFYKLIYTRSSNMNHCQGSVVHTLAQFVSGVAFWPTLNGVPGIKSHMVYVILEERNARQGSEMKTGPTSFCTFVYLKYFKWLDSWAFSWIWSAVVKDIRGLWGT